MNLPLIIANTASNSTRSLQSLSMLIRDYQQSYAGAWHTLIKVSRTLSDLRLHARLDIKRLCGAHTPSPRTDLRGLPVQPRSVFFGSCAALRRLLGRHARHPRPRSSGECCDYAWTPTRGTWQVTRGTMHNTYSLKRAHTRSWRR